MDAAANLNGVGGRHGPTRWHFWLILVVLGLSAVISAAIDIPLGSICFYKKFPPTWVREALEVCEDFGHGFGASLILIAIAVMDPPKRRHLCWAIAGSLGAGIVANVLKLLIPRTRPRDFFLALYGQSELDTAVPTKLISVWNTFGREFSGGAGMQSFPSAHTSLAVGLAVMLSALYPRGRWYFAVLAMSVGLQRVVSSAHFPSDVFVGAAVGWVIGMACANSMGFRLKSA